MTTPSLETESPSSSSSWRVFAIPAVLALIGYVAFYALDAHLRVRRGPWEVTFLMEPGGVPAVGISQPGLGLSNVVVRFPDERIEGEVALPARVRFDAPQRSVPFGRQVFDDLMYLPGTVVLHCFGHEVQMLPRALFLDREEHPWRNGSTHSLHASNKPATLEPPKTGRSRLRPRGE